MTTLLGKVLYPVVGAVLGFTYYKFVGCPSGGCPLTSNPVISTLYGAFMGFALSLGR